MRLKSHFARVALSFLLVTTMAYPVQYAFADVEPDVEASEAPLDDGQVQAPLPSDTENEEQDASQSTDVPNTDQDANEDANLDHPAEPTDQDTDSVDGSIPESNISADETEAPLPVEEKAVPEETSTYSSSPVVADGVYTIASALDTSYVFDVASASKNNGGLIKIWKKNNQSNQAYQFQRLADGSYRIRATHSSKVLAVAGLSASRGTPVVQWADNATANMRWLIQKSPNGGFNFVSADTGLYLDYAANTCTPGADAVVWPKTGSPKQAFYLELYKEVPKQDGLQERTLPDGVYSLRNKQDAGQALSIDKAGIADGVNASSRAKNSTLSQKFQVTFQVVQGSRGWYTIRALCSGKVLSVAGFNARNGANVLQWSDNGTKNMRWLIKGNDAAGYNLVSSDSGLLLDFAANRISSGANAVVWESTGSVKQRLSFQKEEILEKGYYSIAPTGSSLLVGINGGPTANGAGAILGASTGSLLQKYFVTPNGDGTYQFKACHSGKVLDVSSEGKIIQANPSSSSSQRWTVIPDTFGGFTIETVRNDGSVVCFWTGGSLSRGASIWAQEYPSLSKDQSFMIRDASLVNDGLYRINTAQNLSLSLSLASGSLASGQGFRLSAKGTSARQKIYVRNSGSGRVQLLSELSDKAVCVGYGSTRGAAAVQWENNKTDNMTWEIIPTYQGSVYIRNVASGMNLDYSADAPAPGAPIVAWEPHGGAKQMFTFEATTPPPFKVYIDAGHGWNSSEYGQFDVGAVGLYRESDLTNELANKVANECEKRGIAAVTNAYATPKTGVPYSIRQANAISLDCTTLVSIHFNSGGGSGIESYIHSYNAARGSSALQSSMHKYLATGSGLHNRGKRANALAVCGGRLPAVLLEVGFIDSAYDMDIYQNKKNNIARFLAAGIEEASRNSVCNGYR